MSPFDFSNSGAAQGGSSFLKDFAARFAEGLRGAARDAQSALGQLGQWTAQLAQNAPVQWAPQLVNPTECSHSKRCHEHALVTCIKCRKVHCLAHSMINHMGEGMCQRCVCAAAGIPVPVDDPVGEFLGALGLDPDIDYELDEIAAQYKKLAKQHHPDRARGTKAKAKAEARMREINAAYGALRKHYKEAA